MTEEEIEIRREKAYDEVIEIQSLDFMHFRISNYQKPLEEVVKMWKRINRSTHRYYARD